MPDSFAITPEGLLLIANGMQPILRWDGLKNSADPAGLSGPLTAVTIGQGTGASQIGAILGDYYAYVRFLDDAGNVSNFSPISNLLSSAALSGTIIRVGVGNLTLLVLNSLDQTGIGTGFVNFTDIVYPYDHVGGSLTDWLQNPVFVTVAEPHGLTTGSMVKLESILGSTQAIGVWEIIVVSPYRFLLKGITGVDSYVGGGTWKVGTKTINYTSVAVPTEARAVRRQILRNTGGQTTTFYVDVDTTDLVATSFSSTQIDDDLATNTAVPLLNLDGSAFANRNTPPPSNLSVIVHHLGRMFGAILINYEEGSVAVTRGSTTVTGIGTEWTTQMAGRFLYVVGAKKSYEISTVDQSAQTLTLATAYLDVTDPYARYAIQSSPAERRSIFYSEAGFPESWPAINALTVQEDNDELVGLCVADSFIYFLEKRHIYRFTFQANPATDGYVFLTLHGRGCINNRCWLKVEDKLYMLDEKGIYAFDGGDEVDPISAAIQDIFREDPGAPYRINRARQQFFHAVHYSRQETCRWFVCLGGDYLPTHALCYNYRLKRWWIEKYPVPIGASCEATINGDRVVLLGTAAGKILKFWEGTLDGPHADAGTVRGTVTSSSLCGLSDSLATFPASGVVNAPLSIVQGTGKGQVRKIVAVSGTTLSVSQPWLETPDTTSVYQIGGIEWLYRSGWFPFVAEETENPRRVQVVFRPLVHAAIMNIRLFRDFFEDATIWQSRRSSFQQDGVASEPGSTYLEADLTKSIGFVRRAMSGHKELLADGPRYWSVELSGVSNAEELRINEATIEGVRPDRGGEG